MENHLEGGQELLHADRPRLSDPGVLRWPGAACGSIGGKERLTAARDGRTAGRTNVELKNEPVSCQP